MQSPTFEDTAVWKSHLTILLVALVIVGTAIFLLYDIT